MALRFYKHGQGKLSRGLGALATGLSAVFACYRLYRWLGDHAAFRTAVPGIPPNILGGDLPTNWALVVALGVFLAMAFGIYYASNMPRVVDFLLDTEAEMRKVSWPSAREVWGSSLVVLALVAILGLYILGVDYGLTSLRGLLRKFFG